MKARDILQRLWALIQEFIDKLRGKLQEKLEENDKDEVPRVEDPPVKPSPVPTPDPVVVPPVVTAPVPPGVPPGSLHPLPPGPVPRPPRVDPPTDNEFKVKGFGLNSRNFTAREKAWIRLVADKHGLGLPDFRRHLFDGTYDDISRLINSAHQDQDVLSAYYELKVIDWENTPGVSEKLFTTVKEWFELRGRDF